MGWFDGQDIGVGPKIIGFNLFTNIYCAEYVYLFIYFVHVCKYKIPRLWISRLEAMVGRSWVGR
jgi:hypothetical protein